MQEGFDIKIAKVHLKKAIENCTTYDEANKVFTEKTIEVAKTYNEPNKSILCAYLLGLLTGFGFGLKIKS